MAVSKGSNPRRVSSAMVRLQSELGRGQGSEIARWFPKLPPDILNEVLNSLDPKDIANLTRLLPPENIAGISTRLSEDTHDHIRRSLDSAGLAADAWAESSSEPLQKQSQQDQQARYGEAKYTPGQNINQNSESQDQDRGDKSPTTPRLWLYQFGEGDHSFKQFEDGSEDLAIKMSGIKRMEAGDQILLIKTGKDGGLTGLADYSDIEVKLPAAFGPRRLAHVHLRLDTPIPRAQAAEAMELSAYGALKGFRGATVLVPSEFSQTILDFMKNAADNTHNTNGSQQLKTHADTPADIDLLGRKPLAEALAKSLNRHMNAKLTRENEDPFVVHLSSPWGGGKSTFMKFLKNELTASPTDAEKWQPSDTRPWIAVDFNAWQHQHVDPPWWTLTEAIYDQVSPHLGVFSRLKLKYFVRSRNFKFLLASLVVAILFVAGLFAVEYAVGLKDPNATFLINKNLADGLITAGKLLGAIAAIFALGKTIIAQLFPSSAESARQFAERQGDPMKSLKRYITDMTRIIHQPVIIFIDDLDRCGPDYCVKLMEGIQTLFRSNRLVFVIAADRDWLYHCFEMQYVDFRERLSTPGKGLGSLFLEKCFQLSFNLPTPGDDDIMEYWNRLIDLQQRDGGEEKKLRTSIESNLKDKDEAGLMEALSALKEGGIDARITREEIVVRMADFDIAQNREDHLLAQVRHLLEPNPRMMKRFVNAYGVAEKIAILRNVPVATEEERLALALWLILDMRWPRLARHLRDTPEDMSGMNADNPFANLISSLAVEAVINGKDLSASLSETSITDHFRAL